MYEEIFGPLASDGIIKPGVCCCCCLCYSGDPDKDDTNEDADREGT
ncbi:MAG: hypothetical protein L0Y73_04570 [Candidatus Aminicenantes bacterium]|nr:hypothetical protein [Candidatus Aminicenantes bacterium]